ncbi:BH3-interacting domain death agonist isoform X1 [Lacerta agilis]|uniref:BH3-interacting domain death agonist isoform X1 n=1 Tax=Lacerta agilis TaxID=80427 RepID=UPI00141A3403|nr:BH3-interacting domain death agonist isoform X1 [Lacerta agilis]XP_033018523.1 BH3-interacting domain death agonist isoform X1 [Lacerta agilis]
MDQGDYNSPFHETQLTRILLYSFLEKSSDCAFASRLCALKNQLVSEQDDDGELQTDGNRFGQPEDIIYPNSEEEEIFRIIGAQLAEIGDQLAAEIDPSFVQNLARQFMAENMSKEAITNHLSQVVKEVVRRMPLEMEQEKAMLVVAMVLAKKVANTVPSLLQQVFSTTVNYINQNLRDYVNNLEPEVI